MGILRGPNLVKDNLIYCIDPGSSRCYPGSGTSMNDLSVSNLNSSAGTFVSAGSNRGYYLKTDGTGYSTASTNVLDTDYHTICMLFRFSANETYPDGTTGSWNKIFGYEPGTDRSPGIWRYPSNRRIHWTYNPGNTATDFGATGLSTDFDLNKDYYVIMMKNGANTFFWVNGVKYSGITNCANPKTNGSSTINIIPSFPADIFQLKAMQIYNKSFTDDEANQNSNAFISRLQI